MFLYASNPSYIAKSGVMKFGLSDHYLVFATKRNSALKRKSNRVCLEFNDYFGFTEHNLNEVSKETIYQQLYVK